MANFYIVNALGQNLANSNSSALFWDCCKRPRFVISGYVWATQWPISSELKIKFDPSLDRSWCEDYKKYVPGLAYWEIFKSKHSLYQ